MTLIKSATSNARAWLDRLLDRPSPVALVQTLQVDAVVSLLERVGLEDLGDVIALLSPEQLTHVLDHDLWTSSRPGQDEQFDAERFALWLMLWVEESPERAARKLMELDFELVALGLARQVLVIDMEQMAQALLRSCHLEDDEQLEKALESNLYHELEQYRVVARVASSFDAIVALLAEWNTHDYGFLCALLERCCALSQDLIDDQGGLYEVLSELESAEADLMGAREERREARGYVPASSALAFLRLARDTPFSELVASNGPDPITRAHFRAAPDASGGVREASRGIAPRSLSAGSDDPGGARVLAALEELLQEEAKPIRTLPKRSRRASPLARALTALCESDVAAYGQCVVAAAYLANVVLAAVGTSQARFAPSEAAEVAFAVCELGAEQLASGNAFAGRHGDMLRDQLGKGGLVKLFQLGFQRMCGAAPPPVVHRRPWLRRLRASLEAQGLASAKPGPRSAAAAVYDQGMCRPAD